MNWQQHTRVILVLASLLHMECLALPPMTTTTSGRPHSSTMHFYSLGGSSDLDPSTAQSSGSHNLPPLRVAIIGAGPSGQLLSHLLLPRFHVTLFEGRSDPRRKEAEERAYALGLGIRGRTAIRHGVDDDLWQAVKRRGYESERFQLQLFGGKLVIQLRSEEDSRKAKTIENEEEAIEPSVLTFQTALCAALMDELDARGYQEKDQLEVHYDTIVKACDLTSMTLDIANTGSDCNEEKGRIRRLSNQRYDFMVGCDGVNSVVRTAIKANHPGFVFTKEGLPGEFKVVRLDAAPPKVDPTSVSLILPQSGSTTAFVEPTSQSGECCVLFAGRKSDDPVLSETSNKTAVVEALQIAFPHWEALSTEMADQLIRQPRPGKASSIICNTYHWKDKAVLVGDAAHATGGVSGQGVNSALMDCLALAECLKRVQPGCEEGLADALLTYSVKQMPEGKALYDLSFGPKPKGFKALLWSLINLRDTLFRGRLGIGRPPLQTRLTTSLTPFSNIRREIDDFYEEPFPNSTVFAERLLALHKEGIQSMGKPGERNNQTHPYFRANSIHT